MKQLVMMLLKNDKHEDDNDVVTADTVTDFTDCPNDNNQSRPVGETMK